MKKHIEVAKQIQGKGFYDCRKLAVEMGQSESHASDMLKLINNNGDIESRKERRGMRVFIEVISMRNGQDEEAEKKRKLIRLALFGEQAA